MYCPCVRTTAAVENVAGPLANGPFRDAQHAGDRDRPAEVRRGRAFAAGDVHAGEDLELASPSDPARGPLSDDGIELGEEMPDESRQLGMNGVCFRVAGHDSSAYRGTVALGAFADRLDVGHVWLARQRGKRVRETVPNGDRLPRLRPRRRAPRKARFTIGKGRRELDADRHAFRLPAQGRREAEIPGGALAVQPE